MAETPRAAAPGASTSRSREILGRFLLAAGAFAVVFLCCEAALGVIPAFPGGVLNVYNRTTTAGLDCYPTNPRGYFELDLRDPATRDRFESLRVRRVEDCATYAPHAVASSYNSLQFRDREFGPRRPGVRRVAILGDSFTEGQGVKERDAYARVLEGVLNAQRSSWEVLNFGRRGADFPALANTFEEILEFDPDVVLYGMGLNDCEPSDAFRARHAYVTEMLEGPRQKPVRVAGPPPFGTRTALFVQGRLQRRSVDRAMRAWYAELYGERNREGWTRTQESIDAMNRRMRLRGGHLLVATWPVLAHLDGGYPFREAHEAIGRFCHGAGIAWLDLLPTLHGRTAEELWVHPLDPHPNEVAHRMAAHALAPAISGLAD
jgi:lysophospholipase L1-like esterase